MKNNRLAFNIFLISIILSLLSYLSFQSSYQMLFVIVFYSCGILTLLSLTIFLFNFLEIRNNKFISYFTFTIPSYLFLIIFFKEITVNNDKLSLLFISFFITQLIIWILVNKKINDFNLDDNL